MSRFFRNSGGDILCGTDEVLTMSEAHELLAKANEKYFRAVHAHEIERKHFYVRVIRELECAIGEASGWRRCA